MNPLEQCPEDNVPEVPIPFKKSKRYYPDGVEIPEQNKIPEQYNPNCYMVVHGNGKNGSPVPMVESSSDSIEDNQSSEVFSTPN